MNREIKFRGKGIEEYDKDKWSYGSYFIFNEINYFFLDDGSRTDEINEKIRNNIKHKIIFEVQGDLNMENHIKLADVNSDTVGQFVGLHDKNGKEIYEGDIVKIYGHRFDFGFKQEEIGQIKFIHGAFGFYREKSKNEYCFNNLETEEAYGELDYYEVIGNIYDNPELLGGENGI